jgi:hypothetical protein
MAFGPNGVLYLNTWSGGYYQNDRPPDGGFLIPLKDNKGDGRADMIERFGDGVAQGSAGGTGIRVYGRALFAEQNDKIIRSPLPANVIVRQLVGDHANHYGTAARRHRNGIMLRLRHAVRRCPIRMSPPSLLMSGRLVIRLASEAAAGGRS